MSYILDGSNIRSPNSLDERNDTQTAQNRTLDGSINRDYFGSNKRVWTLDYENTQITAYNAIKTIYETYLSTGTLVTWEITEANYTISEVEVHVDLKLRQFRVKGSDYLSDFTLILTEA